MAGISRVWPPPPLPGRHSYDALRLSPLAGSLDSRNKLQLSISYDRIANGPKCRSTSGRSNHDNSRRLIVMATNNLSCNLLADNRCSISC